MNKKRNIVLILVDQMRPDFIGPYGADFIKTPNLDELAANGVTFDNAITASTVCAPARASVMTGKHVSGHDAWTNDIPCKEGTEYIAERMNKAGYMTAAVGEFDHAPRGNKIGFKYLQLFDGKLDSDYMKYFTAKHPEESRYSVSDGTYHFKYGEEDFYDRWTTDRATEFIDSYVKTGKAPDGAEPDCGDGKAPFFLYCGLFAPHSPLIPPHGVEDMVDPDKIPTIFNSTRDDIASVEKYRRAYLTPHETLVNPESAVPARMEQRRAYCELIAEIDCLVGRIVQSLRDNGIYEDTTIIFSSDHGSVDNDYNVVSKGPWPYKAQLFIPMIVSNNPNLDAGTHRDCLCGNLDIGATALDIAGDDKEFGVSRSMIGMANGSAPERRCNMSEFSDAVKTVVDKRYTFTYYPFEGITTLYDRIEDPTEMNNLGGKEEYRSIERRFMMDIIDYQCLAKGLRLEAHDVTPEIKAGIEEKNPKFLDSFDIAYPLNSWTQVERVEQAGLDGTYNEFCRGREIKAHYGAYVLDGERPVKK